jgi:hypothetical protein
MPLRFASTSGDITSFHSRDVFHYPKIKLRNLWPNNFIFCFLLVSDTSYYISVCYFNGNTSFKQHIYNTKWLFFFISSLSLKPIYVQCLEEWFCTRKKDLVRVCGKFKVYIIHELISNFVTLLNADAPLHKSLKLLRFYFMFINVLFQNFSLVFRIAFCIHARLSSNYIYFATFSLFLTVLSRFVRHCFMLFWICVTPTAFPVLNSHNSHNSQNMVTSLSNIKHNLLNKKKITHY